MKKTLLLLLCALLSAGIVNAKPVSEQLARLVARNYLISRGVFGSNTTHEMLQLTRSSYAPSVSTTAPGSPIYYVFNFNDANGFIIISADDVAYPVLGYSSESGFDPASLPPQMQGWLTGYAKEIGYAVSSGMEADVATRAEWESVSSTVTQVFTPQSASGVAPLVTTLWDQDPYYNALCPFDNTANQRTVTGCVATAMAMVMKYHNYPPTGTGTHSYNHKKYGTISANFAGTTYNWASMPNTVNATNNAVATLMFHCGVSVDMDYNIGDAGGSSAWVISSASQGTYCAEYALKNVFGYSSNIQGLDKGNYTNAQWINVLKAELDASRPMVYAGEGPGGGHCFVCDGYNDDNYFHFNWGWGGSNDGYFLLNALNPSGTGTGGGSGSYNNGQEAIIGIKPPTVSGTGTAFFKLAMNAPVSGTDTVSYEEEISFHTNIINNDQRTFSGDIAAGVFDTSNVFIDYVDIAKGITLQPGAALPSEITFTNPGISAMLPGSYYVDIMYSVGDSNWKDIVNTANYQSSKKFCVVNLNDFKLYSAITVSPGNTVLQGEPVTVQMDVYNGTAVDFHGTLDLSVYDMDGDYINFIGQKPDVTVLSNEHSNGLSFTVSGLTVPAGDYLLALWYLPDGSSDWELTGSGIFMNPITINVQEVPLLADKYEPNDTFSAATNLPVSFKSNPATISTSGANCHTGIDYDFYRIDLPKGFSYSMKGVLLDFFSDTAQVFTLDALWTYSVNGVDWSDTYDDTIPFNINLEDGGTIYFHISPWTTGETGTYDIMLTVNRNPLGLDETPSSSLLYVYPNPAAGPVTIETKKGQDKILGYALENTAGQRVMDVRLSGDQSICSFSVAGHGEGMYFLKVQTTSGFFTRKILIFRK